ncbi:Zinc finger protein 346 [Mizuhopecten yessoensis]|uniref:Zinc finger protein 346 n=1 Tax=Mizuhopecten yessoensis TaxID=6573 RepID=A0A210PWY5_MIZYE|nr:Zinc finger protein 346 [Mizuhopecten yessoensis]
MTDSSFRCEACGITLNSIDQYTQHTSGRKHLNKVRPSSEGESSSDQQSGEEANADPFRKVIFTTAESLSSLPPIDLPPPPPPPPTKKRKAEVMMEGCEMCQVYYNSPNQKEVHLTGKKHQKKLKTMTDISPSDPLGLSLDSASNLGLCELCHVSYSSVTIRDQHLNGAKHRKKVQLSQSPNPDQEMCTICNVKYTSPSNKLLHIQCEKKRGA